MCCKASSFVLKRVLTLPLLCVVLLLERIWGVLVAFQKVDVISSPLIYLNPGERHSKSQIKAEIVAAYIAEKKNMKECIQTGEQHGDNAIGTWRERMGKRAAAQDRSFAIAHTFAASMHHLVPKGQVTAVLHRSPLPS